MIDPTTKLLLGDDIVQALIKDLGLEKDAHETQVEIIAHFGENAMHRIILEIFKVLPEDAHPEFERQISNRDARALRTFLETYIPDVNGFIQETAKKEYEETKKLMNAPVTPPGTI